MPTHCSQDELTGALKTLSPSLLIASKIGVIYSHHLKQPTVTQKIVICTSPPLQIVHSFQTPLLRPLFCDARHLIQICHGLHGDYSPLSDTARFLSQTQVGCNVLALPNYFEDEEKKLSSQANGRGVESEASFFLLHRTCSQTCHVLPHPHGIIYIRIPLLTLFFFLGKLANPLSNGWLQWLKVRSGNLNWGISSIRLPVGRSVRLFLDCRVTGKGQSHCKWCHPRVGNPGLCKKGG